MITNIIKGNVLKERVIVFAINTEGINDSGFAGLVAKKYWPELAYIGPNPLGAIVRESADGKQFYAIVCHSLGNNGWNRTPACLEDTLNTLDQEEVACVMIGAGPVGQMQGANVIEILGAMARSRLKIKVYHL